jgi:hypothetical protein
MSSISWGPLVAFIDFELMTFPGTLAERALGYDTHLWCQFSLHHFNEFRNLDALRCDFGTI